MSSEDLGYGRTWMCAGCGKAVTLYNGPYGACVDCGGHFHRATAEDLACDRCGAEDACRVLGPTEFRRLCSPCVEEVNADADD